MNYLSHYPNKTLAEHINEIKEYAGQLCRDYPEYCAKESTIIDLLAEWHDYGKQTTFFQDYIKDPEAYSGNKNLKEHSLLSAIAAFFYFSELSDEQRFMIFQIIAGHHSHLKNQDELEFLFSNHQAEKILSAQLKTLARASVNFPDILYPLDDINDWWETRGQKSIKKKDLSSAITYRLRLQFYYSIFLEADKAYLAISQREKYQLFQRHSLPLQWIDTHIDRQRKESAINDLRQTIRQEILVNSAQIKNTIYSLTAPTGTGKTLLSLSWAFAMRQRAFESQEPLPKIIIVLPFLSIISQTALVVQQLLHENNISADGSWLIESHSLSDRHYSTSLEQNEESFFIDTWRSDIIITTYDQFLYALMENKGKYQMRHHHLHNALIIFDELQSIPITLWKPFADIIKILAQNSRSRFLAMSATLPGFIEGAFPLLGEYQKYFRQMNRYQLRLEYLQRGEAMTIDEAVDEFSEMIIKEANDHKRILITLNTRRSAQLFYQKMKKLLAEEGIEYPMYLISSDIIPLERNRRIENIKNSEFCLVVSTQSVEAGVDIDMHLVIRDFAPLDSLIQIAGRCNRNGLMETAGIVWIIDLESDKGNRFSEMIYDPIHLHRSRQLLKPSPACIEEKDILSITEDYYSLLLNDDGISKGEGILRKWAYWEKDESLRHYLRGKALNKIDLIVLRYHPELEEEVKKINDMSDRWERREAWRRLSGELNEISISVYNRPGAREDDISDDFYGMRQILDMYYDDEIGFTHPEEDSGNELLIL